MILKMFAFANNHYQGFGARDVQTLHGFVEQVTIKEEQVPVSSSSTCYRGVSFRGYIRVRLPTVVARVNQVFPVAGHGEFTVV